jgi:hypothetical protein
MACTPPEPSDKSPVTSFSQQRNLGAISRRHTESVSLLGTPSLDRTEIEALVKRLNLRIAVVAAIVTAMLWVLTSALEAWADANTQKLMWLLSFQIVAFVGALATWIAGSSGLVAEHSGAPIGTPHLATVE